MGFTHPTKTATHPSGIDPRLSSLTSGSDGSGRVRLESTIDPGGTVRPGFPP